MPVPAMPSAAVERRARTAAPAAAGARGRLESPVEAGAWERTESPAAAGARVRVASPAVAGARGVREGPRDSRKRQREDSIELEPVVRAHSSAGVFANTARAKVTEGSHRSMAMAVKERHRLQFSKKQS